MTEKFTDVHAYLYHYTNEQGLYGILKEQCLWATHYKFLNDHLEVEIAREKLKESLFPLMLDFLKKVSTDTNILEYIEKNSGLEAMAKYGCNNYVDSLYQARFLTDEIYLTSFCTEISSADNFINQNGLLSQWRSYGGDGGYAIVFKTSALDHLLDFELQNFKYLGFILGDVIYSGDENKHNEELSDPLRKVSSIQNELFRYDVGQIRNQPDLMASTDAFRAFAEIITRYKHRGFKEEHEVRIIAIPLNLNEADQKILGNKAEKERKFRNKNGTQIPYIELFRSQDMKLPIEKIIVGPHKDKELRADSLRIMLRNTDIKVTVSDIPYIN